METFLRQGSDEPFCELTVRIPASFFKRKMSNFRRGILLLGDVDSVLREIAQMRDEEAADAPE